MRTAVIESGIVVNVVVAGEGWEPEKGQLIVESESAGIGDTYANGVFTRPDAPPEPIPDRVTSRQFFLQLNSLGLLTAVEAWIEHQPLQIQIAFERSGTFVREDTMLRKGFTALGFTPPQIDAFFQGAAAL